MTMQDWLKCDDPQARIMRFHLTQSGLKLLARVEEVGTNRREDRQSGCARIMNWRCLKAMGPSIGSGPFAQGFADSRKCPRLPQSIVHARLWRIWAQAWAMWRCAVAADSRGLRRLNRLWAGRRARAKSCCASLCKGLRAIMTIQKLQRLWWGNASAHNGYSQA